MAEEFSSESLKAFVLLAKSAKGAAMSSLITQVLDHPTVHVFAELLDMPNVKELEGSPSTAPSLELLKIFAYGTWKDYRTRQSELPALTAQQATKLKRLTIISLASQTAMLPYEVLMRELEISSVRELEDLLIESIYQGLVSGRLDQEAAHIQVFSCAGRDVHPDELLPLTNTLLEWHANATGLIGQVSTELGRFVSQADDAKQAQLDLDAKIDKVKAQTRASLESGEGSASYRDGFADSFGGGDEEGEKMRKSSGRMKARPGSKHGARM